MGQIHTSYSLAGLAVYLRLYLYSLFFRLILRHKRTYTHSRIRTLGN